MIIERITALPAIVPAQPRAAASARLPEPGETVLLTGSEPPADALQATTPGGVPLRLTGLNWLTRELRPGDTLALRVLANTAALELELVGSTHLESAHAAPLNLSDYAAMRLDMAELRNMTWRAPSPAALATAWQALAQARWSQALGAYTAAGPSLAATVPAAPIAAGAERWTLPIYGWSGAQWGCLRMNLLLVRAEEDPRFARRRRLALALRVELSHPTLGRIAFDLEWHLGGIQLSFAVEEADAAQVVREALPSFVAALALANLRLVRVRMAQGTVAVMRVQLPPPALQPGQITEKTLPPSLFRAAAEIAVTLLKLTLREHGLNREIR